MPIPLDYTWRQIGSATVPTSDSTGVAPIKMVRLDRPSSTAPGLGVVTFYRNYDPPPHNEYPCMAPFTVDLHGTIGVGTEIAPLALAGEPAGDIALDVTELGSDRMLACWFSLAGLSGDDLPCTLTLYAVDGSGFTVLDQVNAFNVSNAHVDGPPMVWRIGAYKALLTCGGGYPYTVDCTGDTIAVTSHIGGTGPFDFPGDHIVDWWWAAEGRGFGIFQGGETFSVDDAWAISNRGAYPLMPEWVMLTPTVATGKIRVAQDFLGSSQIVDFDVMTGTVVMAGAVWGDGRWAVPMHRWGMIDSFDRLGSSLAALDGGSDEGGAYLALNDLSGAGQNPTMWRQRADTQGWESPAPGLGDLGHLVDIDTGLPAPAPYAMWPVGPVDYAAMVSYGWVDGGGAKWLELALLSVGPPPGAVGAGWELGAVNLG